MLEHLRETRRDFVVIRFAVQFEFSRKMKELGLDSSESDEILAMLEHNQNILDSPDLLCEIPFRSRRESRYSDGTFGVLYASLEEETAIAEITHWFRNWLYVRHSIRSGYYVRFSVHFAGKLKDIIAMSDDWPSLISDSHDIFCKSIATEARTSDLDAIVVPSVRSKDQLGKNVVVFSRDSLGHPKDLRYIRLTQNDVTDTVDYNWVS